MALIEKVVWSVPPDLPRVEILSVENNQRPWCQYHETYSICNINDFVNEDGIRHPGVAEWAYRSSIHQNPARTLMLIEPGEVHRNTKTPPPCDFSVVLLDPKLVNDIASEAGMSPNPHFRDAVTTDPRLYRAFVRFHAALVKQSSLLHRQSLFVECISALLTNCCERAPRQALPPGRRSLGRARDFIEEHFSEKITLAKLAEISELSRYHFLRAFAQKFGLPPHRYQTSLRIEKIRQLLRSEPPALAIEAGFSDQSHLIRSFKSAMGVTPGMYAAMVRSSAELPTSPSELEQQ